MGLALLFDMDGTLVHSDPIHAAVYVDMLAEYGITITEERYIAEFLGRRNTEIFPELLPDGDPDALDQEKEERFRARLGEIPDLVPGTRALLARARSEGWPVALVTNACAANAHAVIARFELTDAFDAVCLGEDCARGKPAPDVYLRAMEVLGVTPAQSLAFEDSPTGLASAKGSGAHVVGMRSSLSDADLRAHGAKATLADFSDPALEPLLQHMQGHRP